MVSQYQDLGLSASEKPRVKALKEFKSLRVIEGTPETNLLLAERTQAFGNKMEHTKTKVEQMGQRKLRGGW